jgi:hypothetical protein
MRFDYATWMKPSVEEFPAPYHPPFQATGAINSRTSMALTHVNHSIFGPSEFQKLPRKARTRRNLEQDPETLPTPA